MSNTNNGTPIQVDGVVRDAETFGQKAKRFVKNNWKKGLVLLLIAGGSYALGKNSHPTCIEGSVEAEDDDTPAEESDEISE